MTEYEKMYATVHTLHAKYMDMIEAGKADMAKIWHQKYKQARHQLLEMLTDDAECITTTQAAERLNLTERRIKQFYMAYYPHLWERGKGYITPSMYLQLESAKRDKAVVETITGKRFKSASEAARHFGISRQAVFSSCQYAGGRFKYE